MQAKDSKLERNCFKSVEKELERINHYFKTNNMDSILITLVINIENLEKVRLKQIAEYVGSNNLNFLPFTKHLMLLEKYLWKK